MRTENLPHQDPALFELARDIFEADNAAALDPAKEWEKAPVHATSYAFGIARGLMRKGYHKTPDDLVKVADVRPVIAGLVEGEPGSQGVAKDWLAAHPEPKAEPGETDLVCSGYCGRFIPWPEATKESGWKITTTSTKDSDDAGAYIRVWCPVCGPFGGQYAEH